MHIIILFSRRRRRRRRSREIGSDPKTDHGRFGRYTSIYASTAHIKQKTYTHTQPHCFVLSLFLS